MNVFGLGPGRCGTLTFARACSYITNFTSGHETRISQLGPGRVEYPDNHIEVDNRLSWFLGRLEQRYGDKAIYVRLHRDNEAVSTSYAKRLKSPEGIMRAYKSGIYAGIQERSALDVARDYVRTVEANIDSFLSSKTMVFNISLENDPENGFASFWNAIDAEGDLPAALMQYRIKHNAKRTLGSRFLQRFSSIGFWGE